MSKTTRREFINQTTAMAALSIAAASKVDAVASGLSAVAAGFSQTNASAAPAIDLAEWSYFWLGVNRAELARGTVVNGTQMYVEYMVPSQVRHPYAIVLEHGGGGQGLDWMETPDGRRGWWTYLVQEGFKVYVIDRPGHGRSPFHPELHGAFPQRATTVEGMERQFTAPEKAAMPYGPQAKFHTQWPGTGIAGDPVMDQAASGQGGSFLADLERTHAVWQQRAAELLDKIGPAIIFTHSAGGPFGWLAGDIRPNLVKAIVGVEAAGPPFGPLKWGLAASKLTYEPPVSEPSELKTTKWTAPTGDVYDIQADPPRKLKNLSNVPIAFVTSESSYHFPYDPASVQFLRQSGCTVDHIMLAERGIRGNAHFMMMEKNNREVLQPILDWIEKNASPKNVRPTEPKRLAAVSASPVASGFSRTANEAALKLADHGHFWITEAKKMPYGTIEVGQMYVQYLTPANVTHPFPVVLTHSGTGQMLEYMGLGDGLAGWAHYYAQAGYRVYLVDRPGQGRAPYHPDSNGAISSHPTYEGIISELKRSAGGPNKQWPGTGDIGDPLVDQLMAAQNSAPENQQTTQELWASRGAALLDRIGPAIVHTHGTANPFGWLVADRRPNLVKALVCVDTGSVDVFGQQAPWGVTAIPLVFDPPASDPKEIKAPASQPRRLKNLQSIPMVLVTPERSGRTTGPATVAFLKQAGCAIDELRLSEAGIRGNGHFMMLENNRRQVFDAIRAWVERKVALQA